VCTRVLGVHGDGTYGVYADRMQAHRDRLIRAEAALAASATPASSGAPVSSAVASARGPSTERGSRSNKLSFKEQRELADLPNQIEVLEIEQAEIERELADPETYRQDRGRAADLTARLEVLTRSIAASYARWEALAAREASC
jgi:ATP-binding cassette subfamily F protein uup